MTLHGPVDGLANGTKPVTEKTCNCFVQDRVWSNYICCTCTVTSTL